MHIDLDKEADALYMTLRKGKVFRTEERGDYLLDYDKEGEILGIEVLSVSHKLQIIKGETVLST